MPWQNVCVSWGHSPQRIGSAGEFPQKEMRVDMERVFTRFMREDAGQDLIEYGLLIGIITVAAIASILLIGPKVALYFSSLNSALP